MLGLRERMFRHFQQITQCIIDGFLIRKRYGHIRVEENEIRALFIFLIVFASNTGAEIFSPVFFSYLFSFNRFHKLSSHVASRALR